MFLIADDALETLVNVNASVQGMMGKTVLAGVRASGDQSGGGLGR